LGAVEGFGTGDVFYSDCFAGGVAIVRKAFENGVRVDGEMGEDFFGRIGQVPGDNNLTRL
jgi:hypothetical protein